MSAVPDTQQAPATYLVDEIARLLGIARGTAYEAIHRGEIPSVRVGRRVLVPRAKFDAWLEGRGS